MEDAMRGVPIDPERIKALRERLGGISQQELANRLGVSLQSVHRWETGKKAPIKPYVEKIEALERQLARRAERAGKERAA